MLLFLLGCVGCEPDDDDDDPPPAYEAPPVTMQLSLTSTSAGGETSAITTWYDPVGDPDWTLLNVGATAADAPVASLQIDIGDDVVTFGGFTVDPTAPDASVGLPPLIFEPDATPGWDLDPPVGETVSVPVQGTLDVDGTPEEIDLTAEYVLVSESETVETAIGAVSGARHYQGGADVLDHPLTADLWILSGTGIVRADYSWEGAPDLFGGSATMAGGRWYVDANGKRTAGMRGVVGPAQPTLTLDTYDILGTFDADKDTHAQMLLLARWADAERAKTDEMPPLILDFGTTWGYYDATLVATSDPLDAAEADEGYVVWAALVDQAAKNEPSNPIAYHCGATWAGTGEGDVQLNLTLVYALSP